MLCSSSAVGSFPGLIINFSYLIIVVTENEFVSEINRRVQCGRLYSTDWLTLSMSLTRFAVQTENEGEFTC